MSHSQASRATLAVVGHSGCMSVQRPGTGALPGQRQSFGPYRVCLVCLGNICRSPMAEVVLREELARAGLADAVAVESAGSGDWRVGERMDGTAGGEVGRAGCDGYCDGDLRV